MLFYAIAIINYKFAVKELQKINSIMYYYACLIKFINLQSYFQFINCIEIIEQIYFNTVFYFKCFWFINKSKINIKYNYDSIKIFFCTLKCKS